MLAHAFHDDPAFGWILPEAESRTIRLQRLFRLLIDSDVRAGFALTVGGDAAATLWRAPCRNRVTCGETLRQALPLAMALGGGIGRALRVSTAIEAHLPARPGWYLHYAGCAPDRQGQGFATAAIRAGLARIGGGHPVYLETARAENLGFYARFGFAVTTQWRVGRDGPRFWSMLRQPA